MENISNEVKNLVGINERFDNESVDVQQVRLSYANTMQFLINLRDAVWRSEAGRNIAIAITDLESSCMRAVKAIYSQ